MHEDVLINDRNWRRSRDEVPSQLDSNIKKHKGLGLLLYIAYAPLLDTSSLSMALNQGFGSDTCVDV